MICTSSYELQFENSSPCFLCQLNLSIFVNSSCCIPEILMCSQCVLDFVDIFQTYFSKHFFLTAANLPKPPAVIARLMVSSTSNLSHCIPATNVSSGISVIPVSDCMSIRQPVQSSLSIIYCICFTSLQNPGMVLKSLGRKCLLH